MLALATDAEARGRTRLRMVPIERPEPPDAAPVVAPRTGAIPIMDQRPALSTVDRQLTVALPILPGADVPTLRLLPAAIGFELDVAATPDELHGRLAAAVEQSGDLWRIDVRPVLGGARARVVHRERTVAVAAGRGPTEVVVVFGAMGEDARLRAFADAVRLPLPEPTELGANLEVWQDAERTVAAGELTEAKRRWERLLELPQLADLAALRIAELYVASGHVNEALAQLRSVSRRYPRTAGAALARLDVLHLESLLGTGHPDAEQVDVAAVIVDRPAFEPFAALRAAMVLRGLGEYELALRRLPEATRLPASWRHAATMLREDLVALAIAAPALRGDARRTAVHHLRWGERLEQHADRDRIEDVVAEAYAALGLFDRAVPLLKQRLRALPGPVDEADVVGRLAHAYRMLGDRVRAREALQFQIAAHPRSPGLVPELRADIIALAETSGIAAARARIAELQRGTRDVRVRTALDVIAADVTEAWGTPAQIVQALSTMRGDDDDPTERAQAFAIALARAGRAEEAAPLLRAWIDRTAAPEARDRLTYHLASCELALGRPQDAERMLARIAIDGTRWGLVARARLRERALAKTVAALSPALEPTP